MTGDNTVSFDEFAESENLTIRGICQVCALPPEAKAQVHHAWDTGYRGGASPPPCMKTRFPGKRFPRVAE